jgi:thioredoxin 1
MSGVKVMQEAEFQREVLESDRPVLVDFFAPWCGPCRMLAPVLEGVAKTYGGRLDVVKVNVDDDPQLAATYGIRGVPTLMIFKGGALVDTMVGLPSASVLSRKLDAVTALPQTVGA